MKVNRCCRDNRRGVDLEEGSLRDGGAGFKVLRGGCSIFCHSLSPYVHPAPVSGSCNSCAGPAPCHWELRQFWKTVFACLRDRLYPFWSRGNPSLRCLFPPSPPSSPPCLAVFDANRLQLHEHGNGILLLRNFKLQRDLRVFFASLNSSTGLYRSIWVFARSETRLGTIILEWESLLIELSPVFQIHVYLSSYYFARFAFFFFIRKIWVI